jgi:hypothetical protein
VWDLGVGEKLDGSGKRMGGREESLTAIIVLLLSPHTLTNPATNRRSQKGIEGVVYCEDYWEVSLKKGLLHK